MSQVRVALKAIIEQDGKILVIKRSANDDIDKSTWDIPGGKIDFGEKPEEALSREIMEETGLKVRLIRPFRTWAFMANEETQVVGITFLAKYVSGEVKLSEEHEIYKWIEPEAFQGLEAAEGLKKEIGEYAAGRNLL